MLSTKYLELWLHIKEISAVVTFVGEDLKCELSEAVSQEIIEAIACRL